MEREESSLTVGYTCSSEPVNIPSGFLWGFCLRSWGSFLCQKFFIEKPNQGLERLQCLKALAAPGGGGA